MSTFQNYIKEVADCLNVYGYREVEKYGDVYQFLSSPHMLEIVRKSHVSGICPFVTGLVLSAENLESRNRAFQYINGCIDFDTNYEVLE